MRLPAPSTLVFTLFLAVVALPPAARSETLGFSITAQNHATPLRSTSRAQVTVLDDQNLAPLQGAQVQLTAPQAGKPGMVTVSKDGYASVTVAGVTNQQVTVYLKKLPDPAGDAVISGTMGDYQVPEDGSLVRAGLVIRAPSVFDLLHFEISSLISPLKDTIDVMGKRKIPSNLVLPKQTVSVFFGDVDLDKPEYRLPLPRQASACLVSVQAQAKTDDLVSLFSGGGDFAKPSTLNLMTFNRVGYSAAITPADGMTQDVPTLTDLRDAHQVSVTPPSYQADVMVAAYTDLNGDRTVLIPTDIKGASASSSGGDDGSDNGKHSLYPLSTVQLRSAASIGKGHGVMALALVNKGQGVAGVIEPEAGANVQLGSFLDLAAAPAFQTLPSTVTLQAAPNSVASVAFEASANDPVTGGSRSYPVWYVYSLPSAGAVAIPTDHAPVTAAIQSYSIEQLEFTRLNEGQLDGRTVMQQLRRFSRAEARKTQ